MSPVSILVLPGMYPHVAQSVVPRNSHSSASLSPYPSSGVRRPLVGPPVFLVLASTIPRARIPAIPRDPATLTAILPPRAALRRRRPAPYGEGTVRARAGSAPARRGALKALPGNLPPRAAVEPADMAAVRLSAALLLFAAQVSAAAGRLGRATRDFDLAVVLSFSPPHTSGLAQPALRPRAPTATASPSQPQFPHLQNGASPRTPPSVLAALRPGFCSVTLGRRGVPTSGSVQNAGYLWGPQDVRWMRPGLVPRQEPGFWWHAGLELTV